MTDFKNVEKGPGWKSPGVTLVSDVFRVQYLSQSKDEVSFKTVVISILFHLPSCITRRINRISSCDKFAA